MSCESCKGRDRDQPSGVAAAKTVVLMGSTGNGKSVAGNTIIGRQVFDSTGNTSTCQLETTTLDDGRILNVIDTPGSFDPYEMAKGIVECINIAKDGIHSFLLVLSFSDGFCEEVSAFKSLLEIFGGKIADYMIVVLTHVDVLGKGIILDDFSKSIMEMCGYRLVVFDYKTEDEVKISGQRKRLISLVESVVKGNRGKPYTNDLVNMLTPRVLNGEMNLIDQSSEGKFHALNEEQFDRSIEMVESRLKESILNLEKQLAEERVARMEADMKAHVLQTTLKNEVESKESIRNLEKQLAFEAARMEAEMKALSLHTKSKGEALELKICLNSAEESRKQLEERLHRVESIHTLEKQLAEERASRLEVETKSKGKVLELKECLNRAEESRKQLEERLHRVEEQLAEERVARMEGEMKALSEQTKSKDDMLLNTMKECFSRAEESHKQLEERLFGDERQINDAEYS